MSNIFRNYDKQQELVGKIPHLKNLSTKHKEILAKMAYLEEFNDEFIIRENHINQKLFFLIKGQVDIIVDEKKVLDLRGGGRLFGEMSFINHSFTSASVKANGRVVMMFINTTDLLGLDFNQYGEFLLEMYKMISEVLAEKLFKTTQLAKSFQDQTQVGEMEWSD